MSNAPPSVALIVEAAAVATDIPVRHILSLRRTADIMRARKVVYLLAVDMTGMSYTQIGRALGERNHATVISGETSARALVAENESFRELVDGTRIAVEALMKTGVATALRDPDAAAVAAHIVESPHIGALLRVTARDTQAMALRLTALEQTAAEVLRLLRLIDELCTGDPGQVRRRLLAREITGLIPVIANELTDLNIKEIANDGNSFNEHCGGSPLAAAE